MISRAIRPPAKTTLTGTSRLDGDGIDHAEQHRDDGGGAGQMGYLVEGAVPPTTSVETEREPDGELQQAGGGDGYDQPAEPEGAPHVGGELEFVAQDQRGRKGNDPAQAVETGLDDQTVLFEEAS